MLAYLILIMTTLGLGRLLPFSVDAQPRLGFRLMAGLCLLTLILFFGDAVLGLGLRVSAWIAVAVGVGSLAWAVSGLRWNPQVLMHPVCAIGSLVLIIMAFNGGVSYEPIMGDEIANWLNRARQMIVFDTYWASGMHYHLHSYPPGWSQLLAFPSVILGRYDEAHFATLPFLLHLAMLGAIFDTVDTYARAHHRPASYAAAAGWSLIGGLLAVEAGWKLFPTLVLVDEPQAYLAAVSLFAALSALLTARAPSWLAALHVGLPIAVGYLFRSTMIAFLPSLVLLAGALALHGHGSGPSGGRWRRDAALVAASLGPFLIVYAVWAILRPESSCLGTPLDYLRPGQLASLASQSSASVAYAMAARLGEFVLIWKLPVTIAGCLGLLVSCLSWRRACVALAVALFLLVSAIGLHHTYLTCFSTYEAGILASLERYLRPPLRLVHIFGLCALALLALDVMGHRRLSLRPAAARAVSGAAGAALLLFASWSIHRSLDSIADRTGEYPHLAEPARRIRAEAESLTELIRARGWAGEPVLAIDQAGPDVLINAALYYAVGRDAEEPLVYRLHDRWTFGDAEGLRRMSMSPEALDQELARFRLIWPIVSDPFADAALDRLTTGSGCGRPFIDFFLVRENNGEITCVAKRGLSSSRIDIPTGPK
jgi:hypothetical protein